jgi:hypothetical protein
MHYRVLHGQIEILHYGVIQHHLERISEISWT